MSTLSTSANLPANKKMTDGNVDNNDAPFTSMNQSEST
jgi:hypothetical protein